MIVRVNVGLSVSTKIERVKTKAPQNTQADCLVTRDDLEALLAEMDRKATDPRAGIFGPKSITWRINRESALFLGAGRAALLQLAHPWVAAALEQHSSLMRDPIARFHGTFRVMFTTIFGAREQAFRTARSLHTLHGRIGGELPEAVAGYARGSALPSSMRLVGPYLEARERLAGRRPGMIARASNRFWIGEQRMPFGA